MMYMHFCKPCHRIFMLNGHKMICPKCSNPLTELQISYLDYVEMDMEEREAFKRACDDENQLGKFKATYRMYKYSKWYKDLQKQVTQQAIIAYPVIDQTSMENALSMSWHAANVKQKESVFWKSADFEIHSSSVLYFTREN